MWVFLQRGVCVCVCAGKGVVCCACVNSKAGNCRTCVIAFQPTIQRVVCLLLFLRVIVIVNCTVTLLSTHTHTHSCILYVVFLVGVSIQLANIAARGAFAIETEDVLDIEQYAHAHALFEACGSCGNCGKRHNWQLTAVATFAQQRQTPRARTPLTAPAISEKANQRQETHVTLQFIYMYFLRHATKSNLLIANVSDAKRNYSHPHGKVATRFQVELSRVCVHSFKKIHSHSQFACVKQVLAWLPILPPALSCCCLRQFMRITFSHFRE